MSRLRLVRLYGLICLVHFNPGQKYHKWHCWGFHQISEHLKSDRSIRWSENKTAIQVTRCLTDAHSRSPSTHQGPPYHVTTSGPLASSWAHPNLSLRCLMQGGTSAVQQQLIQVTSHHNHQIPDCKELSCFRMFHTDTSSHFALGTNGRVFW